MIVCNNSILEATFVSPAPPIPPLYLQVIAAVVYTVLSIMTVGGNALVCLIVFRYMGFATVTNLFIANLALTDFFIGLFCIPIVLISDFLLSDWPFGLVMCKFTSFAQSVFVVSTVYTLIAMSVDRYIAIMHPLQPKLTRKKCHIIIGVVWLFAIVFSSPIFIEMHLFHICFHRDDETVFQSSQTICQSNGLPAPLQTIYNLATITIIYLIPLVVLSVVYIRLGWKLKTSQSPGEAHSERDARIKKSKRKVIKMCFAVVIMFGVCWCPMQVYTNILRSYLDRVFHRKYIPHFYFAFHLMAMSNSCVNPFIYGVMSSKFRSGFAHYSRLVCMRCGLAKEQCTQKTPSNDTILLTASFRPPGITKKACEVRFQNSQNSVSMTSLNPYVSYHRAPVYA